MSNRRRSNLDKTNMSEDQQHLGPSVSQPPNTSNQKQSFLSKFARSEVKSSKSIDKSTHLIRSCEANDNSSSGCKISSDNKDPCKSTVAATSSKSLLEFGGDKSLSKPMKPKAGLGGNLFPDRASKSFCENDISDPAKNSITSITDLRHNNDNLGQNNSHPDDDNDQVLPFWPSKIDSTTLEPSMFQVYSLKDYSQVAGPTENVTSSTAGGRLLKSMSQDRKVDTRTKRMSECIISSQITSDTKSSNQPRQQRLPSMIGKITPSSLGTMGPATSVNSLLPQNKSSTSISESKMDRMRKLFVSPLSLRGSTGGKSTQPHTASSHSRLSLQAGANVLNKPHHLMHAMYRTRVGGVPHYTRRSPMRQKPGSMRGFRVYGCPLSMANTMYPITCFGRPDIYKQQSVPYILARLCYFIEENSSQLTHEGIFRVSGNARLMEKLKTLFDHLGDAPLESESVDVATSASMLKMYLRELPDPLIPTRMNYHFFTLAKKYSSILSKSNFDGFRASDNLTTTGTSTVVFETGSISDGQSTLDRQKIAFIRDLTKLIRKLPIDNYNLLKYLACFLHRISLKQHSNKMSAEALGIVFGPNVFRIRSESYKGLKEQELSNQIMASIISNYKQIFDCEITDALGNLITSEEFLGSNRNLVPLDPQSRTNQEIDTKNDDAAGASSRVPLSIKEITSSPQLPTTSTAYALVPKTRCIRHNNQAGFENSDDSENEHPIIDHADNERFDDEECDDDDESYSQTSDSGSYCSSMASESDESIYGGAVEGEQYDEEGDEFALGSESSSECGSETSYTPSSSHSDTNANEVDLSSSNFSSNHSSAGDKIGVNEPNSAPKQKSCLVCKRRESAQIEANKMREQLRNTELGLSENQTKELHSIKNQELSDANGPALVKTEVDVNKNQSVSVKSTIRLSTRRKRIGDDSKKIGLAKSDIENENPTDASLIGKPARHGNHYRGRLDQRHGPLRRRSSSASSLLRISNKLDQSTRKRSFGGDDHHTHRSKTHSERRKCNEMRAYNRKSRTKAYPVRKDGQKPPNERVLQATSNKLRFGNKSHSQWGKGDCYVPELIAMNLPSNSKDELVWNYVSPSFLDLNDCERFYQLRSYNSDETLLRSQDCTTNSSVETASRARRRFSGQDYLNPNQESLLANISSEFQEISESYEGEVTAYKVEDRDELLDETRRLNLGGVQSSVVSLLSDQLVSFKHSTLSLNDETCDPIVCQLKVIKDLVKTLERLTREIKSMCISQGASSHLVQLVSDLVTEEHSENLATCCFDHLTAKSITTRLDGQERGIGRTEIDLVTQDRLIEILNASNTELKKRYSNLKYIREHYYRHHTRQRRQTEVKNDAGTIERSNEVEKSSLHLDGMSVASDVSSLGSTGNTIGLDHDKKLGNSTKQSKDGNLFVDTCKFGSLCPVEFVFNIEKQLASRRRSGLRLVKLNEMTLAQLQSEKLELQKNLLRYEHWFGRPSKRSEFNLIGHLYERYRAVKIIKQQKQASG